MNGRLCTAALSFGKNLSGELTVGSIQLRQPKVDIDGINELFFSALFLLKQP
jgi:hypothetical protein